MKLFQPIKVNYKVTSNQYEALKWLKALPEIFAADFEVASKFTQKEKERAEKLLESPKVFKRKKEELAKVVTTDGLSHPSMTVITHFSAAWSDRDAFVIVCKTNSIRRMICNWLVTTKAKQIWHNAIYDFNHIYYHTNKFPKNYEDTRLLAKCLLNNANSAKDDVRLKALMATEYGDWAISADEFKLEQQDEPHVIEYSATDAAATFYLYKKLML